MHNMKAIHKYFNNGFLKSGAVDTVHIYSLQTFVMLSLQGECSRLSH